MNTIVDEETERKMKTFLGKRIIPCVLCMMIIWSMGNLFIVDNSSATGMTIYVDDSNTAEPWDGTQNYTYQTIQEGIIAATAGDTVFVFSGSYDENVIITKDLTLTGENKDTTYIDGGEDGHTVQAGIIDTDIEVHLSGFTIKDAGGGVLTVSTSHILLTARSPIIKF
jgi:nitrous oxidase accessory protein NosD